MIRSVPAIALLAFLFGAVSLADTIELRTGERIEGVFKQATSGQAVMEVGGQPVTFPLDKVRAIYLGSEVPSQVRQPSLFSDALDGLNALQSMVSAGVSYQNYAPRVLEMRARVDKYLSTPVANDEAKRAAIRLAMQFHELAASAWGSSITGSPDSFAAIGRAVRGNAALAECAPVKTVIMESDAGAQRVNAQLYQGPKAPKLPRGKTLEQVTQETAFNLAGRLLADDPRILWTCAAGKIAEAERP